MTDTMNLQQRLRLRILGLAELLDLPVVLLDLDCHLCDLLKYRPEGLCQSRRHNGQAALGKARCGGGRHTVKMRERKQEILLCCSLSLSESVSRSPRPHETID